MIRTSIKFTFSLVTMMICSSVVFGQVQSELGRIDKIRNVIEYLASDELGGRKSGEPGDSLSAMYIRKQFSDLGLQLLFNQGLQEFSLISSVEMGVDNHMSFNDLKYTAKEDFLPYSFSGNNSLSASVAFAGYGFTINKDTLQWDDFQGIDVKGKWVLLLKGDPDINNPSSPFALYAEERYKVLNAIDHGAAGVIFTGGPVFNEKDELQGMFYDKNSSTYDVPVLQVTRKVADLILEKSGSTIAELEGYLNKNLMPKSFDSGQKIVAQADVVLKQVNTYNIVAMLPGTDSILKNEYLVIGAHYDHLGVGGPGSGSRVLDTLAVHNGADDNASGVSAVISVAERAVYSGSNRRSLIFVAFGAEEMGLVGSTYFTANPPVDLKNVIAMINFDMVGRLDPNAPALSIGGTKTSLETEEILELLNPGFELSLSGEGTGPSDHAAFYMQDIPVFFISTGAHPDYHTPDDDADKLNYTGIMEVSNYAWRIIEEISGRDERLTFNEAGSKARRSTRGRMKVTLGVMPDFAGQEKNGLRIDAVTKGKPAYTAGILKGDIITAINGNKVGNIYDYMNRMNTFEEGQTISIDVMRDGKPLVLIVQL